MLKKAKRWLAGILCCSMLATMIPNLRVSAQENEPIEKYPFVMFAGNSGESININCNNLTVNGDIHTNGTFKLTTKNANLNGNIGVVTGKNVTANKNTNIESKLISSEEKDTIIIKNKISNTYFTDNCDMYNTNLELNQNNNNINKSFFSNCSVYLTGNNITANANVGAKENIVLNGNCFNGTNANIYSENGNISFKFNRTTINGLVYAPNGKVTINSNNIQINGVIIAKDIEIVGKNVNINYNNNIAEFVNIKSEDTLFKEKIGHYINKYVDVNIPNNDFLEIARFYNSYNNSWIFSYDYKLSKNNKSDIIFSLKCPDGKTVDFIYYKDNMYTSSQEKATLLVNENYYIVTYNSKEYVFSLSGNLICLSDNNGHKLNYSYEQNRIILLDQNGRKTTIELMNGNPIKVCDPIGREVIYNWSKDGNLVSTINPMGEIVKYCYQNNKLINDGVNKISYFQNGRVNEIISNDGFTIGYLYYNFNKSVTILNNGYFS